MGGSSWTKTTSRLAPPTSIVTRQQYGATVRNVSARPGRSRTNADDFMPRREIDAVCAAMIDLKDSFKIHTECMQTQP